MRKVILMMLLATVSSNAKASDWVVLDSAGEEEQFFVQYADNESIRRYGDIVKIWTMVDDKFPQNVQGKKYLSSKVQWEVDCKSEKMRVVYTTFYSGNMGNGEPVLTDPTSSEPSPVSPDSIDESLFKFACGKK